MKKSEKSLDKKYIFKINVFMCVFLVSERE